MQEEAKAPNPPPAEENEDLNISLLRAIQENREERDQQRVINEHFIEALENVNRDVRSAREDIDFGFTAIRHEFNHSQEALRNSILESQRIPAVEHLAPAASQHSTQAPNRVGNTVNPPQPYLRGVLPTGLRRATILPNRYVDEESDRVRPSVIGLTPSRASAPPNQPPPPPSRDPHGIGATLGVSIPHGVPQTVTSQASYADIHLSSLGVEAIFKWIGKIDLYHAQHHILLPVATLVAPWIRLALMARYPEELTTDEVFYSLRLDDVYQFIQAYVSPQSPQEFATKLESSVTFPTPASVANGITADNYPSFHSALLVYTHAFMRTLSFLGFNNANNLPFIDNSPGGVVNIYLKGMPHNFGSHTFQSMRVGKMRDFEEFRRLFMTHCDALYDEALVSRKLKSKLPGSKTFTHPKTISADKAYSASRNFQRRAPPGPPQRASQVHAIGTDSPPCLDDKEEIPSPYVARKREDGDPMDVDELGLNPNDEVETSEDYDEDGNPLKSVPAEDIVFDENMHALGMRPEHSTDLHAVPEYQARGPGKTFEARRTGVPRSVEDQAKLPCYRMMNHGTCSNLATCPYCHDKDVMMAYLERLMRNVTGNPPGARPPKKPGGPTPDDASYSFYEVEANEADTPLCLPESYLNALGRALSNSVPKSLASRAVMKAGLMHPPDSIPVDFTALFDSGALQASYIGKNFLETIRHTLGECIQPASGCVYLADGQTRSPVTEKVIVPLTFTSSREEEFQVEETLIVLESPQEIIIGLPTIVLKLLPLFVDMLEVAADVSPELHLLPGDVIDPWSTKPSELSPEELMTPDPCSFRGPLHYLSMPYAEAKREYLDLLPEHIEPAFAAATGIMNLMKSDLALKVFLPEKWEGVNGIPPIKLRMRDDMPKRIKPPARPINPRLYATAKSEYDRLCGYFYRPSDSPISSPLVVAPKATFPFIRFCGDYSNTVNRYTSAANYPIPKVLHSLEKIVKYKVFLDFDLTNGFHQFRLDDETSRLLSVQTPWGQVEPIFLPEGVPQGSGILQQVMVDVFGIFSEWAIVIFDNLLVLAEDYADAYAKTLKVLGRAKDRNMVLKLKKTWLGFAKVVFFGYLCTHGSFCLTEERIKSILEMPMPNSTKSCRRFLGVGVFFRIFMAMYATLTAPLNDMTKAKFNWDPKTWKVDYVGVFNRFKQALLKVTALFYPDYDLPWILRADASETGIGWVLIQIFTTPDGKEVMQPIIFGSKKFSDAATRWHTYAQEGFAMFYSIKDCEYYLRGKHFTFEGDHANLQWIERSLDAKVIRWKIYMQSFDFKFRHIAGTKNVVADWQSRFYMVNSLEHADDAFSEDTRVSSVDAFYDVLSSLLTTTVTDSYDCLLTANNQNYPQAMAPANPRSLPSTLPSDSNSIELQAQHKLSPKDMLAEVHGRRTGHFGVRRTYELLNKLYPGHGIPIQLVTEYRANCPVCQKNDDFYVTKYYSKPRTLKTTGPRKVVGIDHLTLPADAMGNTGLYALRDHFTRWLKLYPTSHRDATSAALALFSYIVDFGAFDVLISDPGSELMSDGVALLNTWFGIHHRVSLVDRHESNGVEGANKQVLRHLRGLFLDERIKPTWSSPHVIKWVEFICNSFDIDESGVDAYTLVFGSLARRYFDFPKGPFDKSKASEYLKLLNQSLEDVLAVSQRHQQALVSKRVDDKPQLLYDKGTLVLRRLEDSRPHKLHPKYLGPYEVLRHIKNDVECRHLSLGRVETFFVDDLKMFRGSRAEAKSLAASDADQHVIERILAHRGDPLVRTSMYFLVKFADTETLWKQWSRDLFDSQAYEEYCQSHSALRPLLKTVAQVSSWCKSLRTSDITSVAPGTVVFVDLRSYGAHWYQTLPLPDLHTHNYLLECVYQDWIKPRRTIVLFCPVLETTRTVDGVFISMYGSLLSLPSDGATLITPSLLSKFPDIRPRQVKARTLSEFKYLIGRHFRDDEDRLIYIVTRVAKERNSDLVAYVKRFAVRGRPSNELKRPFHVAEAARLVAAYEKEEKK